MRPDLKKLFLTLAGSGTGAGSGTIRADLVPYDKPVAHDMVDRTWIWDTDTNTAVMQEEYDESPGGRRDVPYFDKANGDQRAAERTGRRAVVGHQRSSGRGTDDRQAPSWRQQLLDP